MYTNRAVPPQSEPLDETAMKLGIEAAAIPGELANRMLEREAWARQRLAAHAGRLFVIVVGPIPTAFAIDETGRVASALRPDRAPDLTLRVSSLELPAFLADPTRWDRYVSPDGDPALAATLKDLAPTLPWLVEQTFAKALGGVVGHHVADFGRRMLAFPEYAAQRIGESMVSYAHERSGLLATAEEGAAFAQEVGALANRVDALSARIDALTDRLSPTVVQAAFGKKRARAP
jgi:ubiquinone biosynthesis accessory factor UbiJ